MLIRRLYVYLYIYIYRICVSHGIFGHTPPLSRAWSLFTFHLVSRENLCYMLRGRGRSRRSRRSLKTDHVLMHKMNCSRDWPSTERVRWRESVEFVYSWIHCTQGAHVRHVATSERDTPPPVSVIAATAR